MHDFEGEMVEVWEPLPAGRRLALPADKPLINLVLFLLTLASTWSMWGGRYSLAVTAILGAHEMGHYIACRRHGMRSTLPFFIPFPFFNPFGTLGAVIQIRTPFFDRRSLFDVGAAGPFAGLIVTAFVLMLGFTLPFEPKMKTLSASFKPEPQLLMQGFSLLMRGSTVSGAQIIANPLLYAGWVGLFVTSLNLLPIGQLDGGHILYSVFGPKTRLMMIFFIVLLGILTFFNMGWALLFLILLIFGRHHPPPIDNYTPLDRRRRRLAITAAVIFALTFTPFPFTVLR
ncbi:MAG: site-2 protease family protein [candidate division KSB1 bacterium]|nr:site-2 protease family protein [candidate division KSB1 bacterium]